MKTVHVAIWYDPKKVKARAIKAGWNPDSGEGHLDIYAPEEDATGHESREFPDRPAAVAFLQELVARGGDFYGQGVLKEFEVDGPRCRYCTCRGWKLVRSAYVDDTGPIEDMPENDCLDDD
jgi:hypothetical protein